MRICFSFILICYSLLAHSQNILNCSPEANWEISSVSNAANRGHIPFYYAYSWGGGIRCDNKQILLPVQFEKKSFGIALIDSTGVNKWQTPMKGRVLGLAKMEDKIICFYSPEWRDVNSGDLKMIYVAAINLKNGQLVNEKPAFENKSNLGIDPKIMVNPNQDFCQLLIRYTTKSRNDQVPTKKMSVITLTPALESTEKEIISEAFKGNFIACQPVSDKEFVISSQVKNTFITEKFNMASLSSPERIVQTLDIGTGYVYGFLKGSSDRPDVFYEVLKYHDGKDRVFALNKVDFNTHKSYVNIIKLNKSLSGAINTEDPGKYKVSGRTEAFEPLDLIINSEKVILLSQISFGGGVAGDIVISNVNDNLQLATSVIINRDYQVYGYSALKVGCHLNGDILCLLYNITDRPASEAAEYAEIDLKEKMVKKKVIIKKMPEMRRAARVETESIVWFEDGKVLLPYYNNLSLNSSKMIFQTVSINP